MHQIHQTKHQVRQTKHQLRQSKHQVRQTKHQVRQTETKYAKQNTKYVNLYSKILIYAVLSRIYALFWRTFYRRKKYGGVPKMTNIRYEPSWFWLHLENSNVEDFAVYTPYYTDGARPGGRGRVRRWWKKPGNHKICRFAFIAFFTADSVTYAAVHILSRIITDQPICAALPLPCYNAVHTRPLSVLLLFVPHSQAGSASSHHYSDKKNNINNNSDLE